ncbi:MAG: class I SAM-dependent methyltransferase [Armatimonadota bacterium]
MSKIDYSAFKERLTPCQRLASFELVRPFTDNKHVLDIGCATGDYLMTFGEGSIGTDFSMRAIETCNNKGLRAIEANFNESLPFPDSTFDVVFCSHVMEHVESPFRLLKEMNRLLVSDGTVVIGLPTEASIVRHLKDGYFSDHDSHIYGFSLNCVRRLLEIMGFEPVKTIVDFNLVHKLKLYWLMRLAQSLPPSLTLPISNAYWVIGKKTATGES